MFDVVLYMYKGDAALAGSFICQSLEDTMVINTIEPLTSLRRIFTTSQILATVEVMFLSPTHKNNKDAISFDVRSYRRRMGNNAKYVNAIFPISDYRYRFGVEDCYTQQRTVSDKYKKIFKQLHNELPIDTKIVRRSLNKKDVITKTIYIPPRNLKRAIKKAEAGGKKELQHLIRLKSIMFYSDDKGYFTSEYRLDGCRLFEITQGLQGLKKCYRRMLLSNTGYCDLDAKNSLPGDLLHFIKTQVKNGIDRQMYDQVRWYVQNKTKVMKEYGINKQQYIALILGQRQTNQYLKDIQSYIKLFTTRHIRQHLPIDTKTIWNKYLAHRLFEMEKEKIGMVSELYRELGYETLVFCFDGLILDKTPSQEEINSINEMYNELTGCNINMTIKEIF